MLQGFRIHVVVVSYLRDSVSPGSFMIAVFVAICINSPMKMSFETTILKMFGSSAGKNLRRSTVTNPSVMLFPKIYGKFLRQ